MTEPQTTHGESKMNPAMLWERGLDFFEHGDYAAARRDFKRALDLNPPLDLEKKCREMLKKLSIDPVELLAGAAVLALLIFLFVYFGLRNS